MRIELRHAGNNNQNCGWSTQGNKRRKGYGTARENSHGNMLSEIKHQVCGLSLGN